MVGRSVGRLVGGLVRLLTGSYLIIRVTGRTVEGEPLVSVYDELYAGLGEEYCAILYTGKRTSVESNIYSNGNGPLGLNVRT